MNRYMIYIPAGTQGRLIPCGRDGSLTLRKMQALVDGYIEVLGSCLEPEWAREPVDGIRLVVGEDAKLFGSKRNDNATWLYLRQDRDKIIGNAFLCAEVDGELIGFTKPVAKTICEEFGIDMEDDTWKD
jgi:hypothetical protein